MKKFRISSILMPLLMCFAIPIGSASAADYDAKAALQSAQSDVANWMQYLPDNLFVAHVSIPGTHDAATGHPWDTTTGSSMSTTQEKTLDEQLAAGIRAFDFRPGMNNDVLYCNHGTDRLKMTLEEAFTKLTDYLDDHPSEFYVIHLFRGNVYAQGTKPSLSGLVGAKDDAKSIAKYNELFNEFFNQGKFNDYIVEYDPMLKVKDIRGKMVIFRRDRIDFAHVAKAGNVLGWPGDTENWTEGSSKAVVNASDPTITGLLQATDVSSPENDTQLETELNSLTNLYNYNARQAKPNAQKDATGTYKPYWTMMFTSGALYNENTKGYLENATHTNPHFTKLLKDAWAAGKAGPTGAVFSDWVLTDSHTYSGTTYATMGVELVPTIIANNFYYVEDYILDENIFAAEEAEVFWTGDTEYFLRNVGTGGFLSTGATWGTHAVIGDEGIRVKFEYDEKNNAYTLKTTFRNGGLGDDYYIDNTSPALFKVKREGLGRFSFSIGNDALTAQTHKEYNEDGTNKFVDGTIYIVKDGVYQKGDPMQQWEVIPVDDYFKSQIANASKDNPVDISYMVRGHRFWPNDNDNWTGTTNYKEVKIFNNTTVYASYISFDGTNNEYDKNLALYGHHTTANSIYNENTKWSIDHEINIGVAGIYKLRFKAAYNNFNLSGDVLTFKVNGEDVKSKLQPISSNDAEVAIKEFRNNPAKYTIELDLTLDDADKIKFEISKGVTSSSLTGFFLDDVELIYYGPDPKVTCEFLQKVIDEATAKVNALDSKYKEGWAEAIKPYQDIVDTKSVIGDGTSEANDIYTMMRERVYQNTNVGADYTGAIINNSFEWGDAYGWSFTPKNVDQTKVFANSIGTYHTENCDGSYLFNAWDRGVPIVQTLPSLPAGRYRLEALAVTGDVQDYDEYKDRYVYLLANDRHSEAIKINTDKVNMSEIAWEFDVPETADVTIGILGAYPNGLFDEFGDFWYKADNFRLTYVGEAQVDYFYDVLREAIDYATSHVNLIPDEYQEGWTEAMQPYEDMITYRTLVGDGTREIDEIYALMRKFVLAQNFVGADFTPAILNHSFEWGSTKGWEVEKITSDSGVKFNGKSGDTFYIDNCDGDYLFNTWNNDNWGSPISQTLRNVPAGRYRLEALVASDSQWSDNTIYLNANGFRTTIDTKAESRTHGVNAVLEFTLENPGTLTIGTSSKNTWYKADNFRLTYLGQTSVTWTMTGEYDTLILPFEADVPSDLTIYEATLDKDFVEGDFQAHLLYLDEKFSIEPNTPYLVKANDSETEIPLVANAAINAPAKAPAATAGKTYTFTGLATNDNSKYSKGILTGTLNDAKVTKDDAHYILKEGGYFEQHTANEAATVAANHAYVENDSRTSLPYILVEESKYTGVDQLLTDEKQPVTVYTITGVVVKKDVTLGEAFDGLAPGIYILSNGLRVILK